MADELEVRRVRTEEWAALRAVRLRALADAPGAFLTTLAEAEARPDEQWRDFVARAATSPTESSFVAELDGVFVGMASGYEPPDDAGCVHLVQMWTAPEARRTGLGRRLVDAVVRFAGDRPVRLAVVRGNDGARLLYESMGFVPDDRPALAGDPCRDELHFVRTV